MKKSNDELETQLEALRRYVGILETENAQLRAGSTSIEATSSATGLSFSSATALSKADKSSPVMPQAIAEDLRNISELQSRGGSSFVELDMECQTLRRRVKSQESTIAALKATFAVLMSRLTDAQSQVKALTSEKQVFAGAANAAHGQSAQYFALLAAPTGCVLQCLHASAVVHLRVMVRLWSLTFVLGV